jgi:hypothetical protein
MSLHELGKPQSIEWYTPPELFDALELRFDMDVASPLDGPVPWVPAERFVTPDENGLVARWEGRVWCNPPFGRSLALFAHRMAEHGDGVMIMPARTETRMWQATAPRASAVTFVRDRLRFIRSDGFRGRAGYATILMAFGQDCADALEHADLGWTVKP